MKITPRIAAEILTHEGVVLEAYKDSAGVWTWSVGLAETGGFDVRQYKDNPQPLSAALSAFVTALEDNYAPPVRRALPEATEAQFAAALSFHYNTGGIAKASWVKAWREGDAAKARKAFMNWRKPPEIIPRRQAERDLFFDGKWSARPTGFIWSIQKPSYTPDWRKPQRFNALAELEAIMSSGSPKAKRNPWAALIQAIAAALSRRKS